MSTILLYPTYFPSIAQMAAATKASRIVWEVHDNYQKQTYRNRAYIAHSNGKLLLNVPIKHTKEQQHQKTAHVITEAEFPWNVQHLKSLQSAYRTSPYFEFYEDDITPLFSESEVHLQKHNLKIFETLAELIGLECTTSFSETYEKEPTIKDYRSLARAKTKQNFNFEPYIQVFGENHGFQENLSVLDLLFNEGPNCLSYLEAQMLTL